MAQAGAHMDPQNFTCSLCLDRLKDPVTTSCGHCFCGKCLQERWDAEEKKKRVYSCPQCKKTFAVRPVLEKNIILAALVEGLEKTGLQAAPADHCYAGDEDVPCDICTGRKLKALKSCLVCRASYCDSHLQPHLQSSTFKNHKLVDPTHGLQENICPRHDEMMKMFCRTDQETICYLCSVDEHKGHDTVSAAAERTEKQRELEETRQKIQQKIQHSEKDLKVLQKEVESIDSSADKAVKDSEDIFTQIICLLEKRRSEVQQQVRSTQQAEVSRVKELQKKMEREMTELKRRDAELEKISHTLDHSQFLHNFSSLPALSQSLDSSSLEIRPLRYFEDVAADVSKLRDKIQQVLSRQSLTRPVLHFPQLIGQVVPGQGAGTSARYSHRHRQQFLRGPRSSRVGVYLDHSAGLLSFYRVSGTMELLHRVQTTFSQPLFAGLCVSSDSSVALMKV